jgi:hypothetical protein
VTVAPGDDARPARPDSAGPPGSVGPPGADDAPGHSWRSNPSDDDVDAAFADIVSGMITESVRRHPSGIGPTPAAEPDPPPAPARDEPELRDVDDEPDSPSERARRRELRRLERAAELEAFRAGEEQERAERDADQEHFTPPDPPPLPRPKLRTVGSVLMILGGILLLARPGILSVAPDLALVLAMLLIVGGAVLLVTGIWRRRGGNDGDGWDDGAIV